MQNKLSTLVVSVLVIALTVAVYYVGVGAGANRKEAEMKAEKAFPANPVDETLIGRVADLEAKDKAHEAAMNGAAQGIVQIQQAHQNWVRQSFQSQTATRGIIGLMERALIKDIGNSKWEKHIKEARKEIEANASKMAEERRKAQVRAEAVNGGK